MRMFDSIKGYKTATNAERALRKIMGECLNDHDWIIATNSEGRFYPVILRHRRGEPTAHLIRLGANLCVAG